MKRVSRTIDLNADLGEGFPDDAAILAIVSSASISCGAHAGDPSTIRATLQAAKAAGVVVGAHPGYPDREHFGRVNQTYPPGEIVTFVTDQIRFLDRLASSLGIALRFIKPHGALYNQAQNEPEVAEEVVLAATSFGLPILGLPNGCVEDEARKAGLRFVPEGFPERKYTEDGRLVDRSIPGSVLTDPHEVESQVVSLVARGVQTLCIHGDDPDAVAKALNIQNAIRTNRLKSGFWG